MNDPYEFKPKQAVPGLVISGSDIYLTLKSEEKNKTNFPLVANLDLGLKVKLSKKDARFLVKELVRFI